MGAIVQSSSNNCELLEMYFTSVNGVKYKSDLIMTFSGTFFVKIIRCSELFNAWSI